MIKQIKINSINEEEKKVDIYVTKSSMPTLDEYVEELKPIFDTHMLTNMGPVYKKFQHQLIDYLKVPDLSLFANGHLALEMALQAFGFPKGSEIITTPFTFVSTTHAIVRRGFVPVFADIKEDDYTIDPDRIEELVTDKTVAILPVHVYGHVCDVDRIDRIAKKYNLKVLYDAAHAFGEVYNGIAIGNFGDATMFSFHATKVFNSVEGGAIAYKNPKCRKALHELKNFGIEGPEDVTGVGGNAKMSELHAAMGICNLRHLDSWIEERHRINDYYDARFKGIAGLKVGIVPDGLKANYGYYPIEINPDVFGSNRNEVFDALLEVGIHARKYFYPIVTEMEVYRTRYGYNSNNVPIAKRIGDRIITIPIYPGLDECVQEKICDVILGKN